MELRTYQATFVNEIAQAIAAGNKKLVAQLPTGAGKTVIFASISQRYIAKQNKRVLILVHRKELLQQTRVTAHAAFNLVCQPIIAGMKYIPPSEIYVGMVETTWRRLQKVEGVGLIIVDECHRLEFAKFAEHFKDIIIIGFSATPLTASKSKPLKLYYENIVCGIDIPELIQQGHLCQNITYAPKDIVQRAELRMRGNDFDEQQMAEAYSAPRYIFNTVEAYKKWCLKLKTLVFNVNIKHSLAVEAEFIAQGYNVKHLDSTMSATDRAATLKWYKETPDAILCNVNITTTGFDEPTIEAIIVNRATMSMPLWIQMCGRGSRPTPAKNVFIIIDMGANAITHGDWCQARNWYDLFLNPPKKGKPTAAAVKSCPVCDAILPAATKVCPYCGYVYPDKMQQVEIELGEYILVTKNIDVEKLIKNNRFRKEHYPFFHIGEKLAIYAKSNIAVMTDDYAQHIKSMYLNLAREWMHIAMPQRKFNKWYETTATTHLFTELKNRFPYWKTNLITISTENQNEQHTY